jgi:hypothetical protein
MNEDAFNMSLRAFPDKVAFTSQRASRKTRPKLR